MKLGIVGLPNVGKSTLFNAITNAGAQSANYPFCTIEPNLGVVAVPDERLELLAKLYNTKSVVPATVEFADIAGLVKGASKGEGLGNRFLAHIREVDAVVHVVRCFEGSDIVHVEGSVDPLRDIETVNLELIFSDAELVDKKLERTAKAAKADKSAELLLTALKKVKQVLDAGRLAKTAVLTEEESLALSDLNLLTGKPVLYVCNMSEEDFTKGIAENKNYMSVRQMAEAEGSAAVPICAELEAEISSLSGEEKQLFLKEAGIEKGGLDLLIACSYDLLGLMSFLTAGEPEVRAWTIRKGTSAKRAAGKIHSDMERGFIRAEIINYRQLLECGSLTKAREKGLVRSEGKDYIMQDGDVALFRFNV